VRKAFSGCGNGFFDGHLHEVKSLEHKVPKEHEVHKGLKVFSLL
jgi:hypothetical protein